MRVSSARQDMIRTAAALMRERGVEATSFSDVLEKSGAPRGSIYHHFPGGKGEMVEEATRWAGQWIARAERQALEHGPLHMLKALFDYWRAVLRDSEFEAGCPVAAVAVDSGATEGAREAAAAAFTAWIEILEQALQARGVPKKRAMSLAAMVIAATEGAVILARAQRSIEPLDQTERELRVLLRSSLAAPRQPR